ncbi:MAG: (d)CMP kinase, partial [Candidatus Zipacnadales bacterium]
VKIFLTATPQERARRRYEEERAKGEVVNFEQVLSAIRERDERDTGRKVAPLKRAPDAIEVVTDGLSVEEVVERILELVKQAQAS